MNVTMSVKGTRKLTNKLRSPLYAAPVSRFLRKGGLTILGNIQDVVPRFDGNLVNSLTMDLDNAWPPRFVRVSTNAEYAPSVEFGRLPGKRPPVDAIKPWADAHGIPPMALAISIGRKGTKAHPFMKPGLTESKSDIKRFLYQLSRDIEVSAAV